MQALGQQPVKGPGGAYIHYERHRPEESTLYRLVQKHAATFFSQIEEATGTGLPKFVKDEFDSFLECGIFAHGFLRLRCGRPMRLGWAKLLKRVFNLDSEHCPNCGGELKIIAAILEVSPDTKGPEDRLCLAHAKASVPWQAGYREDFQSLGSDAIDDAASARGKNEYQTGNSCKPLALSC